MGDFLIFLIQESCLQLQISHWNVTAVERPQSNDKDVGSDPTAARYEKRTLGTPQYKKKIYIK